MEDDSSAERMSEEQPTGERWDPLGAPNDDDESDGSTIKYNYECDHSSHCSQ